MIRSNLFDFLRRFVNEPADNPSLFPRRLWVDALCINQTDQEEKSNQVALMPEIYKSCIRVLISLGAEKDFLDPYILDSSGTIDDSIDALPLLSSLASDRHLNPSHEQAGMAVHLGQILSFRWWNRIWVLQEVLLAKETFLLLGRRGKIDWSIVVRAAASFIHHSNRCCPFRPEFKGRHQGRYYLSIHRICSEILRFHRIHHSHRNQLLSYLWAVASRGGVTDPRDRIYALLGIIGPESTQLRPDYGISWHALTRQLALDNIHSCKCLDVLMGCRSESLSPSWYIDWSEVTNDQDQIVRLLKCIANTSSNRGRVYNASAGTCPTVTLVSHEDRLLVQGSIFDEISQIGSSWTSANSGSPSSMQELLDVLTSWRMQCQELQKQRHSYPSPTQIAEQEQPKKPSWTTRLQSKTHFSRRRYFRAFWRLTLADTILRSTEWFNPLNISPHEGRLGLSQLPQTSQTSLRRTASSDAFFWTLWWKWFNGHRVLPDQRLPPAVQNIYNSVILATTGRRLIVTKKGFIGLGPARSQVGDIVAILNGGSVPFVVRQVTSFPPHRTRHEASGNVEGERLLKLLGDCFVQGIMDGEAFPVPSDSGSTQDTGFTFTVI